MRTLLLARHGQSVANASRRFQGSQDVPLSELGCRQAAALGAALRGGRLTHVYSSPMERARLTAGAVVAALGVPLTLVDDLRELSLGEWEGCTVDEIRALPGDPYARWVRDPVQHIPPGGEPLAAVQERALRAIEAIAAAHPDGDDVLVVSHGGLISAFLAYWLGMPLASIWRLTVGNGSLSRVAPPRVLSLNETAHLSGVDASAGGPGLSP
jgi:broad specificity phosphatase PhoE